MRICAQAHCATEGDFKREFSPEEALYYNKVTLYFYDGPYPILPYNTEFT